MQTLTARRLRWLAPFAAAAAVAAAAVIPGVAAGSDHPSLPPRTAAQLLADLATTEPSTVYGTVVETARLGLPELPSTGGGSAGGAELSLANLVTGSHTARIWIDGADHQRIALVGDLAESDVVHDGNIVWIYSSTANQATHFTLPAGASQGPAKRLMSGTVPTPADLAAQALAAVTPTTRVDVDRTARVAGRAAYQLVLSPKDAHSLITSVRIAIDSQTKVPLRVQVYGRDRGTPAFETGFTNVSFGKPPASVFHFVPPTGAKVVKGSADTALTSVPRRSVPSMPAHMPTVIGSGWTAVAQTDGSALSALSGGGRGGSGQLLSVLLRSAKTVPQGSLITTALWSALLTHDGRLYVGAVDGAGLQAVVATGKPV